jgi:hypothetical protein
LGKLDDRVKVIARLLCEFVDGEVSFKLVTDRVGADVGVISLQLMAKPKTK